MISGTIRVIMNKSVKQGRFELLDLCRGIAALIVVGIHTFSPNMKDFWPVVDFFFVLSGFVIAPMYLENLNARSVIRSRLIRLWPTIIYTLLFGFVLQTFMALKDRYFISNTEITTFPSVIEIVSALFFLQVFFPTLTTFDGPLWSTSVELIVNFALIFLMLKYKIRVLFCIIFIAEVIYYFGLRFDSINTNLSGPISNSTGLARGFMGISLGIILRSQFSYLKLLKNFFLRLIILFISFYILIELVKNFNFYSGFFNFILCGYICIFFALCENPRNRFILRLCELSRKYSFGIFAIHQATLPIAGRLCF
jgi:peptidoglycan/LPS O-acetylase OafA/YrhL